MKGKKGTFSSFLFSCSQTKFDTKTVSSLSVEIGPFLQFTAVQCAVAVREKGWYVLCFIVFVSKIFALYV